MQANLVSERHLVSPLRGMALAAGVERAFRQLVAGCAIVKAWHLPEAELALRLPQRRLDLGIVLPALPGDARLRVHAVDDNVDVGVLAIAMGDEQGLVFLQSQVVEHPIRDEFHAGAVDRVRGIERERDVIDWLLDPETLIRSGLHEAARDLGVVDVAQVPGCSPGDPVVLMAGPTDL